MKQFLLLLATSLTAALSANAPVVIQHSDLQTYGHNGNSLSGLSTQPLGAVENEVWRSSLAVGGCTPPHSHDAEEVFILLRGSIRAIVGEQEVVAHAPATLICPAGIEHQLFNAGEEPTDHLVVLRAGSDIFNTDGELIHLPWRE